jgi:hypothetical protein
MREGQGKSILIAAIIGAAIAFLLGFAVHSASTSVGTSIAMWMDTQWIWGRDWIVWTSMGAIICGGLGYFFTSRHN